MYVENRCYRSVSASPPGCRTVLVGVTLDEPGDPEADEPCQYLHHFLPVISIQTAIVSYFGKDIHEGHPDAIMEYDPFSSPEEAMMQGFSHARTEIEHEAIVIDLDGSLTTANLTFQGINQASELVCCPWPTDRDGQEFSRTIAKLKVVIATTINRTLWRQAHEGAWTEGMDVRESIARPGRSWEVAGNEQARVKPWLVRAPDGSHGRETTQHQCICPPPGDQDSRTQADGSSEP
jgi:hypothetical protein